MRITYSYNKYSNSKTATSISQLNGVLRIFYLGLPAIAFVAAAVFLAKDIPDLIVNSNTKLFFSDLNTMVIITSALLLASIINSLMETVCLAIANCRETNDFGKSFGGAFKITFAAWAKGVALALAVSIVFLATLYSVAVAVAGNALIAYGSDSGYDYLKIAAIALAVIVVAVFAFVKLRKKKNEKIDKKEQNC